MYGRVENAGHRLTLSEELRIEDLWSKLMQASKTVLEQGEAEKSVSLEDLKQSVNACDKLALQIGERRNATPDHVPDRFVLIKQPIPMGGEFDTCMERMALPRNRYGQFDKFDEQRVRLWPYNDYSTHPVRHIRPFSVRATQALGETHVYAVIVADTRRRFRYERFDYLLEQCSHALTFDWLLPINWYIDLFNYSVVQGPYSDQCAYDIYHKRGGLMCLRWNESHEWHQEYEKAKLARVVQGRWLLHLVAPFGRLSHEQRR